MRNLLQTTALVLALAAAYTLGTLRAPAHADANTDKIESLLHELVRAESSQADSLKSISRSSERLAR